MKPIIFSLIAAIFLTGCAAKNKQQPVFSDTGMMAGNAIGGGSPVGILIGLTIGLAADIVSALPDKNTKKKNINQDSNSTAPQPLPEEKKLSRQDK